MEEDNHEYIWEIKPYSFANEDKKLEGEMQLPKYINVNPNYYLKGGHQIADGEFIEVIKRTNGGDPKSVAYTISYYVQDNGLILYKFERNASDDNDEEPDGTRTTVDLTNMAMTVAE